LVKLIIHLVIFFGCDYVNRRCDMSGDICQLCPTYPTEKDLTPGTCAYRVFAPTYQWNDGCLTSYWNYAPSIGVNGKFCIAYR